MLEQHPAEFVSTHAFGPTLERLVKAIQRAGMTIFARIDHARNAENIGMEMPPTVLLLYGSPRGGTPIMQAAPQSALNLPLRVLVREKLDGGVVIAFYPIVPVLRQTGVPAVLASRLEPAQRILTEAIRS